MKQQYDLTKAGVHPDLVARMREWEAIPAAERIALEVAPLCPHGTADPAVCPDCLAPPPPPVDWNVVMNIPEDFHAAKLSDLPKPLLDKLGPFLASWPPARPMLWLGGNVGAGKTHTAIAVLRHLQAQRGVVGQFWPVNDMIEAYRAASVRKYDDDSPGGKRPIDVLHDAMTHAPVLVIDDVGTGRDTEFSYERMYMVVNARAGSRRPTIVTTNVPADALDPRIRSRLLSGVQVTFKGQDRRIQ